jgi:hypothetical protein
MIWRRLSEALMGIPSGLLGWIIGKDESSRVNPIDLEVAGPGYERRCEFAYCLSFPFRLNYDDVSYCSATPITYGCP